jgi:SAM-dependent methyltransferase
VRAVERELRLTIPHWSSAGALVNEPGGAPYLEGRTGPKVVLRADDAELTAAHVGARIERMRANGVEYLVVPADVYPWLERHAEVRRYLRTQFDAVESDETACLVYRLQRHRRPEPATGDDGLPLPPRRMIELVAGPIDADMFFSGGRYAAIWIREMLARNGIAIGDVGALLDFGCGCGRVIRHWHDVAGAGLHGCDYNPYLVRWCSENLPFADFTTNGLDPPLPYADDSFELLYGLSVLTHLDEPQQTAWMAELTRVVKPGGHLLLTFHGRSRVEGLRAYADSYEQVAPRFDAGELVILKGPDAGGNACSAYHPERYIREQLARGLEVVDYAPGGALDIQQDAVLFRTPA